MENEIQASQKGDKESVDDVVMHVQSQCAVTLASFVTAEVRLRMPLFPPELQYHLLKLLPQKTTLFQIDNVNAHTEGKPSFMHKSSY